MTNFPPCSRVSRARQRLVVLVISMEPCLCDSADGRWRGGGWGCGGEFVNIVRVRSSLTEKSVVGPSKGRRKWHGWIDLY
jgi:hypothetical protein